MVPDESATCKMAAVVMRQIWRQPALNCHSSVCPPECCNDVDVVLVVSFQTTHGPCSIVLIVLPARETFTSATLAPAAEPDVKLATELPANPVSAKALPLVGAAPTTLPATLMVSLPLASETVPVLAKFSTPVRLWPFQSIAEDGLLSPSFVRQLLSPAAKPSSS